MKFRIKKWVESGCAFSEGSRIFIELYGRDNSLGSLLKSGSKPVQFALRIVLCKYAGIKAGRKKFREDYPFLKDTDCPTELKILAADKISAYHKYVSAHDQLFSCATTAEQLIVVRELVESYIDNMQIHKELKYYKEHQSPLGDHPIFAVSKLADKIRNKNIVDLIQYKKNLQDNIYRIEYELAKGKQKHLEVERRKRLEDKGKLLRLVEDFIDQRTA